MNYVLFDDKIFGTVEVPSHASSVWYAPQSLVVLNACAEAAQPVDGATSKETFSAMPPKTFGENPLACPSRLLRRGGLRELCLSGVGTVAEKEPTKALLF